MIRFDYAIVELEEPIGQQVGYSTFGWKSKTDSYQNAMLIGYHYDARDRALSSRCNVDADRYFLVLIIRVSPNIPAI